MKKLIALLLALAMLLALAAGCTVNVGSEKTEEKTEKTEQTSKTKDKDKDDEDEDGDEDGDEKSGKSGGSLAGLFGLGKKDPDQPLDGPGSVNEPAEPGTGTVTEPGTGTVTEPTEPTEPAEPGTAGTGTAVTPAGPELPDPFGERIAYEILDVELEGQTLLEAAEDFGAGSWLYAFYAGGYGIEPSENPERTKNVGYDTWLQYYAPYSAAEYCGWGQAWLQAEYWLEPYPSFVNATASSELDEKNLGLDHSAKMVYDGTLENAWCEGVDGCGEGECVTVEFDDRYVVRAIEIYAGYHKSEELYYKNSRPREIMLVFDGPDGIETETHELSDVFSSQFIVFERLHYCTSITIFVQSVYRGTTYDDTLISELYVY